LITGALVDVIAEARKEAPVREAAAEAEAYSSYEPTEGEEEDVRRRRRPRRKRRPKPEAIAARLKTDGEPATEGAPEDQR
jgi:hypothetical protein